MFFGNFVFLLRLALAVVVSIGGRNCVCSVFLAQPGSGGKRREGLASEVRGTVKGPPESLKPETVGELDCEDKVEEAKPKTKAKLKTKKQRGSSGSPASVTWWESVRK